MLEAQVQGRSEPAAAGTTRCRDCPPFLLLRQASVSHRLLVRALDGASSALADRGVIAARVAAGGKAVAVASAGGEGAGRLRKSVGGRTVDISLEGEGDPEVRQRRCCVERGATGAALHTAPLLRAASAARPRPGAASEQRRRQRGRSKRSGAGRMRQPVAGRAGRRGAAALQEGTAAVAVQVVSASQPSRRGRGRLRTLTPVAATSRNRTLPPPEAGHHHLLGTRCKVGFSSEPVQFSTTSSSVEGSRREGSVQ